MSIPLPLIICVFALLWVWLYFRHRDIFSPWSVTLLVWVVVISCYCLIDHGLFKVTDQFGNCISIWVPCFCGSALLTYRLTPAYKGPAMRQNKQVIDILTILCVVLVPLALYKTFTFAMANGSPTDLLYNVRKQVIDKDEGFSLGPLAYFMYEVYILLLVFCDVEKIDKKRFLLALALCMMFFVMTLSKQMFFRYAFSTMFILYARQKISLKPFIIFGALFLVLGLAFTGVRSVEEGHEEEAFTFMDLFGMYVVSPIIAFCDDMPCSAVHWGENTFRPFYHIAYALGLVSFEPTEMIQEFTYVGIPTNVYTMMSPYFKDFGYAGILVFSIIEGAFIGSIYKLSRTGHTVMRLFYAYFVFILAVQFFDELFFQGFSGTIQVIVLLYLCHMKFVFRKPQLLTPANVGQS